jgi:hypothetical protein
MVDKNTTSPPLPGWSWLAATVAGIPLLSCAALAAVQADDPQHLAHLGVGGWIGLGLALIALSSPALGRLPRLRGMPARRRATWALLGAAIGTLLTAPWGAALLLTLISISCHNQECF